jgi:hypothetical protein
LEGSNDPASGLSVSLRTEQRLLIVVSVEFIAITWEFHGGLSQFWAVVATEAVTMTGL